MKRLGFLFGLLLVLLFVLSGCNGSTSTTRSGNPWNNPDINVPDTTSPTIAPAGIVPDNATPAPGDAVMFSVTATDNKTGALVYTWDDGNAAAGTFTGTGASVSWTTDIAGPYIITVTVRDAAGNESTTTFPITVEAGVTPPPPNNPPTFSDPLAGDVTAPVATQKIKFKTVAAADPDGDPLTYAWSVTGGTGAFTDEAVDATDGTPSAFWAADAAGTFTITLTADDGKPGGTATATADVTAGAMPTDFTVVGYAFCGNCHTDKVTDWQTSRHSTAFEVDINPSAYGFRNEHCYPCHAAGYEPVGSGGFLAYDLTPQFANIQCESCHGTGNPPGMGAGHKPSPWDPSTGYEHNADGTLVVDANSNRVDYNAYVVDATYDGSAGYGCGLCHEGNRHGAFEEWAVSDHAIQALAPQLEDDGTGTGTMVVGPPGEANCVKCHNGQYFVSMQIDGGAAPAANLAVTDMVPGMHINCSTCHDPHNAQYASQLRVDSTATVTLPFEDTVVAGGKGDICLKCHNGRRTVTDRDNSIAGTSGRGMHPNNQGTMLFGVGAWEFAGYTYDSQHPHNTWNENKCVTCHMYRHGYYDSTDPTDWGHDWKPDWRACNECHVTITDDATMQGFIDDTQTQIQTLLDDFVAAWPAAWKDVTDPAAPVLRYKETNPGDGDGPVVSDPTKGDIYRQALWDYKYITSDGSKGVHNSTYSIELLQSAIDTVNTLNAMP